RGLSSAHARSTNEPLDRALVRAWPSLPRGAQPKTRTSPTVLGRIARSRGRARAAASSSDVGRLRRAVGLQLRRGGAPLAQIITGKLVSAQPAPPVALRYARPRGEISYPTSKLWVRPSFFS